jgi:FkbM family methyltransferase
MTRFCLSTLKAWIDFWRLRGEEPVRLWHYVAASITLPVIVFIYVWLIIIVRWRGPIPMPGQVPGGATMDCQLPDAVQFYVFLFGVWEPDISAFVQRRLSAGDTFCDIGSHVGYYSLLAAARVGTSGRVVAIEASPTIFGLLQKNMARNEATNVRPVNVAVSAQAGVINIHLGPLWNLGWSTTRVNPKLGVECQVPALPLDQILSAEERQSLRLVKLDVEGTERELFPGLIQLLKEARPDAEIVLEVSPLWWKESPMTVEQALQPFIDAGYHVYLVNNTYNVWRYYWSNQVEPPRRVRGPLKSWIGQHDLVLSREDREEL